MTHIIGAATGLKFRTWLGQTQRDTILRLATSSLDEFDAERITSGSESFTSGPDYLFQNLNELLKLLFCCFYSEIQDPISNFKFSKFLNRIANSKFSDSEQQQAVFNRLGKLTISTAWLQLQHIC